MIRVSEKNPCPICQKSDWCCFDDTMSFALCPRIEEGSIGRYGAYGFIHRIRQGAAKVLRVSSKSNTYPINWQILQDFYESQYVDRVGEHSIIGEGWDGEAQTFPLYDSELNLTGIQRRFPDGSKRMIKGSKSGIFRSHPFVPNRSPIFICEGATDTKVALHLGFNAIGRLSCNSNKKIICELVKKYPDWKLVIIADNDDVGRAGAKKLSETLFDIGRPADIVVPFHKDLRVWFEKEGGTSVKNVLEKF